MEIFIKFMVLLSGIFVLVLVFTFSSMMNKSIDNHNKFIELRWKELKKRDEEFKKKHGNKYDNL